MICGMQTEKGESSVICEPNKIYISADAFAFVSASKGCKYL